LLLLAVVALAGCASLRKPKKKRSVTAVFTPERVGTVAVVNSDLRFVLLDVGSLYTPPPGMALKTFSSGTETGVLAVGAEKERPYIAADIVSGSPRVGDVVEE
jgi:hypothetical protein